MTASLSHDAIVAFLRELLHVVLPDSAGSHVDPTTFVSLSDGKTLYLLLSRCAPAVFRDGEEVTADLGERGRMNRLLRREHLRTLLNGMTALANSDAVAKNKQSGGSSGLIVLDVDIGILSGSATLMGLEGDGNDDDEETAVEALQELTKLTVAAIALIVLSGALSAQVRSAMAVLSPENSGAIQDAVDGFAARYGLTQQQGHVQKSDAVATSSLSAPTSSLYADPSGNAADPGVLLHRRPETAASGRAETSQALPAAPLGADDSYFRNATTQLRREVEALKAHQANVELELRRTKESEASWERRYRMLLEEQASMGQPSSSSSAVGTGTGAGQLPLHGGPEVSDLKQRLASKEEAVQALVKKVEEQAAMLSAFREATAAQEQGLLAMRRKLKSTEEGLMAKAAQRREAMEKLSIAEDKLAIQVKAKNELENEVEELRSQVTILRLTQQEHRGGEGDERTLMNSSFASNGSLDRVMQLENELDEARNQREALQKQLFILQRQVTAAATPMADVGAAANDTLKAQIRHLEKEREQLQQQLATALGRVEDLQNASSTVVGAGAAVGGVAGNPNPHSLASTGTGTGSTHGGSGADLLPQAASADSVGASAGVGAGAGGGDSNDLPSRLRKLRDTTRREHAMLSSLLLQYGYKNLMLQQHQILLHEDHKAAEASAAAAASQAEAGRLMPGRAATATGGAESAFAGSYLARQRREVEQGLLESIIHGGGRQPQRATAVGDVGATTMTATTATAATAATATH